jgi:hypothetical protein
LSHSSTDIAVRLRADAERQIDTVGAFGDPDLLHEAADVIEQLLAELADAEHQMDLMSGDLRESMRDDGP